MSQSHNRQELNRRFKAVYAQLQTRGEIVKHDRQKSHGAFAKRLGTKGHVVTMYLNDKRCITFEQAKELCKAYAVNELYMFQGVGEPFGEQPISDPEQRLRDMLGITGSPNILFSSVPAHASDTVSVDLWEEHQQFEIPGVTGDLVAFEISGPSMEPTICPGDMVLCSVIDEDARLKENEVYAVVTNQSVYVKRLRRLYDSNGRCTHLQLISDNETFRPFRVEIQEVRKILCVTRRLTGIS